MVRGIRLSRLPAPLRHAFHHQPHAHLRVGQAKAGPGRADDLPGIQLHAAPGGRFPRTEPAPRLHAAARRRRPVGQYRQRGGIVPPGRPGRGLWLHHAAGHDRLGRQDGQDVGRRGLAQSRHAEPLRILAVLAQYRGCRCRALPAPLHRPAAGRDRAARSARRRRDQRRQGAPRQRGDDPAARRRGRTEGRGDGPARPSPPAARATPCRRSPSIRQMARPRSSACSWRPVSPVRTARCAVT